MPNPAVPETVENDPWLQDDFLSVNFQRTREEIQEEHLMNEPFAPQFVEPPVEPAPAPVVEPTPAPVAEEDEPLVFQQDDGSSVSIEKTRTKGWKGTIDTGTGAPPEVFYGQTKNELLQRVMVSKVNATKKIRDLNRQVKLGTPTESTPSPEHSTPQTPVNRELTADEIVGIQTKLQSNPDLALAEWFQKKTGLSVNELVQLAREGQEAKRELQMEAVNRAFVSRNPGYYADPEFENFKAIVGYMAKHKISKTLTERNRDTVIAELVSKGHWTVSTLEEAYHELQDDGLLVSAPRAPKPQPQPPQETTPTPAPERSPERIVRTETRPRAGLGIRTTEAAPGPVAPEPTKPPSAEDFDSMTDEQVARAFAEYRQRQAAGRRR